MFLKGQAQNLEKQNLFNHFGDCKVFKMKWIIFVSLSQFAEVLYSFLVITKSFSQVKFWRLLWLLEVPDAMSLGAQSPALGDLFPTCLHAFEKHSLPSWVWKTQLRKRPQHFDKNTNAFGAIYNLLNLLICQSIVRLKCYLDIAIC